MRINTEDYLTPKEAAAAIEAPNQRAVYRAILRARAAGHETTVSIYGKTLIPRLRWRF